MHQALHNQKERESKNCIDASLSSKSSDSSITELNCVNTFVKKDFLISFMKVTVKTKKC